MGSGESIEWSNGTTWQAAPGTGDNPDLGGLWENASANDVRVLQAGDVLTFVNRLGETSAGRHQPRFQQADKMIGDTLCSGRLEQVGVVFEGHGAIGKGHGPSAESSGASDVNRNVGCI